MLAWSQTRLVHGKRLDSEKYLIGNGAAALAANEWSPLLKTDRLLNLHANGYFFKWHESMFRGRERDQR